MAKKKALRKKRRNPFKQPIIGRYIDTPTKAEFSVSYFIDDLGRENIQIENLPAISLKLCRFQLETTKAKAKGAFVKRLQSYLELSSGYEEVSEHTASPYLPLVFGLLRLRKGKTRKFVLIKSATQWYGTGFINIVAVVIDNLLYLDLVNKLKNKP